MCKAFNLNYDILTKHNNKGISIEHFHHFLNKSVTIATEESVTTNILAPAGITVGYTWNSAPIDGMDILRSILAIGSELKFPLEITLNEMPKMVQNNDNTALYYLKLTDSSCNLSFTILKLLIEDRRIVHAERINNCRNLVFMHTDNIVIA